jgi:hypothetical protein
LRGIFQGPNMPPLCLDAKDEVETYATEGSPNIFSTRSSLSDLTMNSSDGPAVNIQRLVDRYRTRCKLVVYGLVKLKWRNLPYICVCVHARRYVHVYCVYPYTMTPE